MKTQCLFAALIFGGISFASAQNNSPPSQFRQILENERFQNMARDLKNDPEAVARAAQENPRQIANSVTAIISDQTAKKDSNQVPATRSKLSQTDKGIENLRRIFERQNGKPSDSKTAKTNIPSVNDLKNLDLNDNKLNEMKRAANGILSEIVPIDDPVAQPRTSKVPAVPSPPAPNSAQTPPPRKSFNNTESTGTPLSFTGQAPPPPVRTMQETTPQIPNLDFGAAPAPQPLRARYPKPQKFRPPTSTEKGPANAPKPDANTMVITSSRSEMDRPGRTLTFFDNVIVEMEDMEMLCDKLVVYIDQNDDMERIVATGGTVELKRMKPNGEIQVAKARRVEYVKATDTTVLSGGPPYIQDGPTYVNTDSPDSRIILRGNGKYTIDSPKDQGRNVIVVPLKGTGKFKGDILGDKINKLRQ